MDSGWNRDDLPAAPSYSLTVVAAGKSSRFHPLSIDEGTLEFVRNTSLSLIHI